MTSRVSRAELDLFGPSTRSSPDQDAHKLFLEHFPVKYKFKTVVDDTKAKSPEDTQDAAEGEVYEFRLFASRKDSSKPAVSRIRLDSPVNTAVPGLLRQRPRSYYFKDKPTRKEKKQLKSAAMIGEQVIARSRPWIPELKMEGKPWKVHDRWIDFKVGIWLDKLVTEFPKKKTRPGKKSRMAMRKREQKNAAQAKQDQETSANAALAERMKKSKKNRDKKLRQREKEKAKKAAARAEAGQAQQ